MLETLKGILTLVALVVYTYAGDNANYYLKYHLLNQRRESYGDTGEYIVRRIILAVILGWLTIPVSLLHYMAKNKDSDA